MARCAERPLPDLRQYEIGSEAVSGNANGCIVPTPKILPCGDSALTVEFGDTIDPDINGMVLALDDIVRARAPAGLLETVPTYRSLTVQFDPVDDRLRGPDPAPERGDEGSGAAQRRRPALARAGGLWRRIRERPRGRGGNATA